MQGHVTRSRLFGVGIAVVSMCALSACGSDDEGGSGGDGADTIKIGATTALSGPVGPVCSPLPTAATAYFDKVNEDGGVLGKQIDYIVKDDAYDATRSVANVRDLLQEDVVAVVGGCGTVGAAAIQPILNKADVPYLWPYAALDSIVEPAQKNFYGLLPLYEEQIKALVPFAYDESGPGSTYVVTTEWPGSDAAVANTEAAAEAGGGSFVGSEVLPPAQADFGPTALKIKEADPDYLVLSMSSGAAGALTKVLVEQDALPAKLILGTSTMATGAFVDSHEPAVDSLLRISSPIELPAPAESECLAVLEAADIAPEGFSLFGCAQAEAFVKAIEEAGDTSKESIYKALDSMSDSSLSELMPPVSFSADNHLGLSSVFIETLDGSTWTKVGEENTSD